MDLLEQFIAYIKKNNLFQQKDKLLLAVSGGVDSVVLCELCYMAGYEFSIAHCNFKLRGDNSNKDEAFVKGLAEKYKVDFFVKQFDTTAIAQQLKKGIEETARDLRYEWFAELTTHDRRQSSVVGRHYILTAHHADDNIETVLMNFFRGTGIKGLHGILPKKDKIIRPLLFANKKAIINFATENNLSFVADSTNAESDYTRNYFRNILIPGVEKVFPKAQQNILNNIERFREVEILYKESIDLQKKKLMIQKGNEYFIPVLKMLQVKPLVTVLYEMIKDFGFTSLQTEEVVALLQSESGKYVQSQTHRIINNRKWLIISPNKTIDAANILIETGDNNLQFELGVLQIEKKENIPPSISKDAFVAQLDHDKIQFPLLLRKWKQGDYFYPLGMTKKKKLSRFFIDQKLSLIEKEKVWVVEMNKKIVWVVGMRIDDRFKITTSTKNTILFRLKNADA
ncbi:tRNA lysidine(34) synthetase TilS [Ferruginibacter sp. SUN002]|uniref:tRNA lysidine(34) synthetase TilS n=1 Tax=Ferruginibacter sp. SUN002 TaxID=2937789 RepID=UPI003D36DA90